MNGNKISTHILASAIVMVLAWCVRNFFHIEIPAEIGIAIGTIVSVLLILLLPERLIEDGKQGGFVQLWVLPWVALLAVIAFCSLSGCAMGPQAEVPKTIPEQVEAANLLVDKLSDGIVEMTCTAFKKGQCIEPGKPLMPDAAIKAHESVQRAHAALMMTSGIPVNGVGECLGAQRSQIACLAAASALLAEVDRMLIAKKGVQ